VSEFLNRGIVVAHRGPFSLSTAPIHADGLKQCLANPKAGALVVFEGLVRNHNDGREVLDLQYEAYEELAVNEAGKIIAEARSRFDIYDALCVHRAGRLEIGDIAVWVGVTAAHRRDAFQAAQFIIDEIKTRLPIWKKETYTDGSSGWVNCAKCHH